MKTIKLLELETFINQYLNIKNFEDYCPNGLQVDGKAEITKIAFAVSATLESIDQAILLKADTLIVHHGLFWKFHGTKPIIGPFGKRVRPLIKNDVSLLGYHLPLDAHLEIGNAASIAKKINLTKLSPFGDHKGTPTGVKGVFETPIKASELKELISKVVNHNTIHACFLENSNDLIKSMGIITGGANSDWVKAKENNLDSYLTGEMSEHDFHESRESGIHMFASGHNATEELGIQSLMNIIKNQFGVETVFIPSLNPA